ncbi:MAG: nucleotidyl transferase AbiEii/AbiGii toxin family protein [Sandaracinaceae bacterium]|nr:nucleotidyl transferase AbiEii/AbiGii toxin family protein [Myxococcales bacterium]MCB9656230.1 nucleotidyl transferase AbiEii/AbiGii toxin family protein [Sandaracinaceae bacterium]
MLTREQLQRAASDTGFPIDSLEKVSMLVRLLNLMAGHPFLGPRVALKGGTALNLFVFDLPRLSVDVDVNYIGGADRETMMAERTKLDTALAQVASRLGLSVKRAPGEHAGGKWRLSYTSALGRPAIIEVDVNYMLRVPLWDAAPCDSKPFLGDRVTRLNLLDRHELAAGKLAALLARGASRDLFDARELLARDTFDRDKLRLAFVVYGGINRVDWRTVSASEVTTTASDVKRLLLPMLRQDIRPADEEVERWTSSLVDETRARLGAVLPLLAHEARFLERLNSHGVIEAALLTTDSELQRRIEASPGLKWKALNVKKHAGLDE